MATTTLATIRDRMSISVEDYWHSTVTTALAASTSLVDTALQDVRSASFFTRHWALVTSGANFVSSVPTKKKVSADDGTSTLTVLTAWLTDGSTKSTYELHQYDPSQKVRAINQAARETYPTLFRKLKDGTLVTGNALPDGHFEWWTSTALLKLYTGSATITLLKTSGTTYTRGGTYSVKATAGAADDYFYINSDTYPRLLDLMNTTIDFECKAYPQTANDAFLDIIYTKSDGTTTTVSSTTTCIAGQFTLLKNESVAIPDNIKKIEFRWRIHTNGQYVYFDNAKVFGVNMSELMLPYDFQNGNVQQVHMQTSGHSDVVADDLGLEAGWSPVFGCNFNDDGTYRYLVLPQLYSNGYSIRLIGDCHLEDTLSADTDTMAIDGEKVSLFVAYANYLLFSMLGGRSTSEDNSQYQGQASKWLSEYYRLKPALGMRRGTGQISWTI